jgi:hypothetical protein
MLHVKHSHCFDDVVHKNICDCVRTFSLFGSLCCPLLGIKMRGKDVLVCIISYCDNA